MFGRPYANGSAIRFWQPQTAEGNLDYQMLIKAAKLKDPEHPRPSHTNRVKLAGGLPSAQPKRLAGRGHGDQHRKTQKNVQCDTRAIEFGKIRHVVCRKDVGSMKLAGK